MLKVTVINEIMKVGSTIPLRVTCSDFKQYILKGINKNVPTGKALFNGCLILFIYSLSTGVDKEPLFCKF